MNEIFLCIKDFHMLYGDRVFTKGIEYTNIGKDSEKGRFEFMDDSNKSHIMNFGLSKHQTEKWDFFDHFTRVA